MAGEVGHVIYAARLLTYLGDAVLHPQYWAGTLFPDIRHLGVISRHHTHLPNVGAQTLVGQNDFMTGMRVHAWIDATREQYLRSRNMKEYLPWHPFVPHALKLLEDELLYDHFDDWNLVRRVLNTTYDEEIQFVQSVASVHQWHSILQQYFQRKPDDESRLVLAEHIGLSPHSAEEMNTVVERLRHDGRAEKLLEGFWRQLESILA